MEKFSRRTIVDLYVLLKRFTVSSSKQRLRQQKEEDFGTTSSANATTAASFASEYRTIDLYISSSSAVIPCDDYGVDG